MAEQRACRECGAILDADLCRQGYGSVTCPDCARAEDAARGAPPTESRQPTADSPKPSLLFGSDSAVRPVAQELDGLCVTPRWIDGKWWWVWRRESKPEQVHAGVDLDQLVEGLHYRFENGAWVNVG